MRSCLERLARRKEAEKKKHKKEEQIGWGRSSLSLQEDLKENGGNEQKGPVRVKIVMKKEELQWLVAQMKDQKGWKSLEEVLEEIEKARRKDADNGNNNNGWKPSLDTIME